MSAVSGSYSNSTVVCQDLQCEYVLCMLRQNLPIRSELTAEQTALSTLPTLAAVTTLVRQPCMQLQA